MKDFKYEQEDCENYSITNEKREEKQYPRVTIPLPATELSGLTVGGKFSITLTGELCEITKNNYRTGVEMFVESGSIKKQGNAFSDMVEDS